MAVYSIFEFETKNSATYHSLSCSGTTPTPQTKVTQITCVQCVPDELIVVEEGCVFDQAEALFHSVHKGLDLQVGHLIQREEADSSKHIQQVRGLQVESLQILKHQYGHTGKQV